MIYSKDGLYYSDLRRIDLGDYTILNPSHEQILRAGYKLVSIGTPQGTLTDSPEA